MSDSSSSGEIEVDPDVDKIDFDQNSSRDEEEDQSNVLKAYPEMPSETLDLQFDVESSVVSLFDKHDELVASQGDYSWFEFQTYQTGKDTTTVTVSALDRQMHAIYLRRGLFSASGVSVGLYASQPWVCYWCLNGLALLGSLPNQSEMKRITNFLRKFRNDDGGFGGSPGSISHLGPTYSSTLALALIGTPEAFEIIDKKKLYQFLMSLKQENGSFVMHEGGEVDVRASYIVMVVATLVGIVTPELTSKAGDFIASCQTYEGGIGATPGCEAHGGYSFCGLAAMALLNETYKLDMKRLCEWAVQRQMTREGGFQGRTNKLVDGCYSWWQGGLFPLLDEYLVNPNMYKEVMEGDPLEVWPEEEGSWLMNQTALLKYILVACQSPNGGLRDKPIKPPDYYHSCYVLSGLATAQHNAAYSLVPLTTLEGPPDTLRSTLVGSIHPIFAIPPRSAFEMKNYFARI